MVYPVKMAELYNVKISSTLLGFEHGILTFMLMVASPEGWSQGFGGFDLRRPTSHAVISDLLRALGVDKWEGLQGQLIRVKSENGTITAVGHILEDSWISAQDISNLLHGS